MKTTKRLYPILRITQREHEEQEVNLAMQLKAERTAKNQMDVLKNFRDEYDGNLQAQNRLHVSQLQNHRGFIQQIDIAIEQQEQKLIDLADKTNQQRNAWQQSRNKRDNLEKLIDKRRTQEVKISNKKEQDSMDDLINNLQVIPT